MARLSPRDADRIETFSRELEVIADVLRQFVLRAPPNIVDGLGVGAVREAFNALGTAGLLRTLSLEAQRNLLDLFTCSAGEMLDDRFESDLVKALFGFDAIVGNYASPYAAGSAYVMLHHAFGEVNGNKGSLGPRHRRHGRNHSRPWRAPRAKAHGVVIETDAPRGARCWWSRDQGGRRGAGQTARPKSAPLMWSSANVGSEIAV